MAQENLDTLRRLGEAFNRGDIDTALLGCAPDVVARPAVYGIDTRDAYHGRAEVRTFWDLLSDGWDSMTIEQLELFEAPPDRAVVLERWHFRGRDGIELDVDLFDVYTFRDGLIVKIEGFRDRAEALDATRQT